MARRYSVVEQRGNVMRWLLSNGRRRSEAACEVAAMNLHKLRRLHQGIQRALDVGEFEQVRAVVDDETTWVIRRKGVR